MSGGGRVMESELCGHVVRELRVIKRLAPLRPFTVLLLYLY